MWCKLLSLLRSLQRLSSVLLPTLPGLLSHPRIRIRRPTILINFVKNFYHSARAISPLMNMCISSRVCVTNFLLLGVQLMRRIKAIGSRGVLAFSLPVSLIREWLWQLFQFFVICFIRQFELMLRAMEGNSSSNAIFTISRGDKQRSINPGSSTKENSGSSSMGQNSGGRSFHQNGP